MIESKIFTTVRGFNAAYKDIRQQVIEQLGLSKQKHIRLCSGSLVLYGKYPDKNEWFPITDGSREVMRDQVKYGNNCNMTFKFVTKKGLIRRN